MALRLTIIYNGTASIKDVATDPKGNITIHNLLLQYGISRDKNDKIWLKRDHAKNFRSKPFGDYSHLIKQHHENATIVISPSMPSQSLQLPLPLPQIAPQQNSPAQVPIANPPLPSAPTPRAPRYPNIAAQKKKKARDRLLRKIALARRLKNSKTP